MRSDIQNETALRKVQIGKETTLGTAVTPTAKLGGMLNVTQDRPLVDKAARDGTFGVAKNPKFGTRSFGGTYDDELSYEDFPILLQYGVAVAPSATDDGEAVHGYTRAYRPGQALFSSFSAEEGVDGLLHKARGLQFGDFTISMDIDDADGNWKWSGNLMVVADAETAPVVTDTATAGTTTSITKAAAGWTIDAYLGLYVKMTGGTAANIGEIAQITTNSATVLTLARALPAAVAASDTFEIFPAFTALTARDVNYIQNEGTQLFIASSLSGLATASNEIIDKMIKFSVTFQNNLSYKKFANNIGVNSSKRGRAKRMISGVVTMEFDDPDEKRIWEKALPDARAIKFQQLNGPVINASPLTNMNAVITVPKIYWEKVDSSGDRAGNMTADYAFKTFADSVAGYDIEYSVKNALATLPA
jgi:hypothetical protein